jgi:PHD/YefM family antitoxin component YafN of YafNO toxin-antitoxin module
MTNPDFQALSEAVDKFLGDDDTANVLVVERENGPDMALIRADALEVLRMKAAQYDAMTKGNEEDGRDAMSILNDD